MEFKLDDNQVTVVMLWKKKHIKYCPIKKDVMRWYTMCFAMNDRCHTFIECACGSRCNLDDTAEDLA